MSHDTHAFKRDENGHRYSAGNRVNDGAREGIPLTISFSSFVTKVTFDDEDGLKATGVEYLKGDKLYSIEL